VTSETFLNHRIEQAARHENLVSGSDDPMTSLISVEINVIDACNRVCGFCPHADPQIYPNRHDWIMPTSTSEILVAQLAAIQFKGRISISGFGEPMLSKDIYRHIEIFRAILPENSIEMNTNADVLNPERIRRLFRAGLSQVYVNLYDGAHQVDLITAMFHEAGVNQYIIRPHWSSEASFGLILNNRSGVVNPTEQAINKRCHYPFYKLFVDWNGNVQFCANDWGRNIIVGNILRTPVRDIWMSDQMKQIRLRLAQGDRSQRPCNQCDVDGTLHSHFSFNTLMTYYKREPV
jgi:radical SAM protein with 4Fe4S-binding SPASM domain